MKIQSLSLITMALVMLFSANSGSAAPFAAWSADTARVTEGGYTWEDPVGGNALMASMGEGISLGEKPGIGSASRSVVFSGEQKTPFLSQKAVKPMASSLKVHLVFKAAPGAENDQTLMRHGNWELRYSPQKQILAFVVFHAQSATIAKVTAALDAWHDVSAEFEAGTLSLTIDGQTDKKEAPSSALTKYAIATVVIGAAQTTSKGPDDKGFRPFRGALGEVTCSME